MELESLWLTIAMVMFIFLLLIVGLIVRLVKYYIMKRKRKVSPGNAPPRELQAVAIEKAKGKQQ